MHRTGASLGPIEMSPLERHLGVVFANAKAGTFLNRNDDMAKILKNMSERKRKRGKSPELNSSLRLNNQFLSLSFLFLNANPLVHADVLLGL